MASQIVLLVMDRSAITFLRLFGNTLFYSVLVTYVTRTYHSNNSTIMHNYLHVK